MTDTNSTDGAALLPVTEADIAAQKEIAQIMVRWGPLWPSKVQELLARHRLATQEDAEQPSIDYWNEVAQRLGHESICEALEKLAGLQEDAERSGVGSGTLADIAVQLSAIRTVMREAHFALDDSEDLSHLDEPVHAVPLDNVMRLHRALKACERFAGKDEAWDGPGPLVTRIIEHLGHLLNRSAALQVALEDICDPIAALRRYASEQGRQLDGAVAFQMSNDPDHLKGIARAALAASSHPASAGDEGLREALAPFAAQVELVADHYDDDYCPDWSPFIPAGAYRAAARALSTPAMSDLQRLGQEYDGEAVREALAEAYRKGATDVHTYWQNNPGEPPQGDPEFGEAASDYAASALDIFDSSARAALAHPAQARDEMREARKCRGGAPSSGLACVLPDGHDGACLMTRAALSSGKGEER